MKKLNLILSTALSLAILGACTKDSVSPGKSYHTDGGSYSDFSGVAGSGSSGSGNSGGQDVPSGQMTAGEWNDLENWGFWKDIIEKDDYKTYPQDWGIFLSRRFSVTVTAPGGVPLADCVIELRGQNGQTWWAARTDNSGKAELWAGLFGQNQSGAASLRATYAGQPMTINNARLYSQGVNVFEFTQSVPVFAADLLFVVDATGSMGDEITYLQAELSDVLARAQTANAEIALRTGAVFYRDEGDEYVTRVSPFTSAHHQTLLFINQQKADGGGDYPEAVHSALKKAMEMDWSQSARARLLFLILDAPAHEKPAVLESLRNSIREAASKGIKIIPVSASGIDKKTEFLLRFIELATNGTYVFITDHSGIGNPHLEPTVGEYEVEFLNDLMVRLIKKYLN